MRKLKLAVESLSVESFEAHAPPVERGTVHGAITAPPGCVTDEYPSCGGSCDWCGGTNGYTCEWSCAGSCGATCPDQNTCYHSCEAVDTCFPANC